MDGGAAVDDAGPAPSAPDPHSAHGSLAGDVFAVPKPAARRLGLWAATTFDLGRPSDVRIPDAGLLHWPPLEEVPATSP